MAVKEALMLFQFEKDGARGGRVVIEVDRGMVKAKVCVFEFKGDDKTRVCGRLADALNAQVRAALEGKL